jgi:hypothetical protein
VRWRSEIQGGEPLYKVAVLQVGSRRLPETAEGSADLSRLFGTERRIGEGVTLGNLREPPAAIV